MAIFTGAGVAMVTPMKDNGEIDYKVLGDLIEDQIAGHTDAIIICGTTGEAPTLEDDEHLEAIRYTVEKAAGRIPVIAGTGSNNTAHAIMMSKEAQKLGADGCLLVAVGAWVAALPFLRPGWAEIARSVLAGLCFGGGILLMSIVMDKLLGKESLGGGDVKLFAVVGLYLGFAGGLFTVLLSCVLGLGFALVQARRGRAGQPIPFGPSISLAAALMLLFGQGIIQWYTGLLGL